jgi:hypothetical protein
MTVDGVNRKVHNTVHDKHILPGFWDLQSASTHALRLATQ